MSPENVPQKWDHESDVLIIGAGTAGLPAGTIAAEEGLKATVLESRPKAGGSFAMVAGAFAIAGSDEQKELGIEDTPELFYQDFQNVCEADPEVARAFCDNQIRSYRMLKEEGVKFPGIVPHPCHSRERCLGWLCGLGPGMVKAVEERCKRNGVEILYRHRAQKLIMDPQSRKVIGATVEVGGEVKKFKANKGVIITSGGFGRNKELVFEYEPIMVNAIPKMPVGHQGDGLKMGLDVGAATKDIGMAVAPSWPVCVETHSNAIWLLDYGAIFVNVHGKRYHDESSSEAFYGPMTGAGMKQPGGVYWIIFTDAIKNQVGTIDMVGKEGETERNMEQVKDVEKCKTYKADTIEELGRLAGVDPRGLKETVDKYNGDIDEVGYDTVFGRKFQFGEMREMVKIDPPPYYAIKCVTSTTSMKGGLKINGRCQVLDNFGNAIPGLYAAGEVSGGLHTKTYLLGVMSSSAMTQGIIAAEDIVKA
ncbi:MAG: FAD-binding protein [Deltaproteobacteria bacterium]|nr:FAD-binding protein [Deltaproteobacteria bacterium]